MGLCNGPRRTVLTFMLAVSMTAVAVLYIVISKDREGRAQQLAAVAASLRMQYNSMVPSFGCVRIPKLNPSEVLVNQSLFFVETNRRTSVDLTARQACSIESAARWELRFFTAIATISSIYAAAVARTFFHRKQPRFSKQLQWSPCLLFTNSVE